MRKFFLFYFLFCFAVYGEVQVALTFDDFPMSSSPLYTKEERVEIYLEKLDRLGIQTVFFCIGSQLDSNRCLELVDQHHQLLANHTQNHLHLSQISLAEFEREVLATKEMLKGYRSSRPWFRFPYLDYGDIRKLGGTQRKRVGAFKFLKKAEYQHGYITINTFDWHINSLVTEALEEGKEVDWERVKEVYLSLLEEWMDSYHSYWEGCLKRPFSHVLLLHQNDLNALFLEELVTMIQKKGWKIISPDVAFSAPIPLLDKFGHFLPKFKHPPTLSCDYINQALLNL